MLRACTCAVSLHVRLRARVSAAVLCLGQRLHACPLTLFSAGELADIDELADKCQAEGAAVLHVS